MVMEYLEGGSVFDVMHKRKKKLDLGKAILLAKQAALGMNYLHLQKPQVIHRDLKSINCNFCFDLKVSTSSLMKTGI